MYDYDPELWAKLIESTMKNYEKRLQSIDFWVYSLELYDRQGNAYSQVAPKLAINFK